MTSPLDPPAAAVLVVEDERIVAKDLQQTLSALGYDAFAIASSAEEAIAKVSARRPDVVLMDIRIRGGRDGIDVADELRTRFGIPVIYLTAHADEGTVERARKTHPYGYLLKPVKAAELRIALEIAVYKIRAERRLRERERWHETTLEALSDAVLTVDLDGVVGFVNRAAEALLLVPRADAVGRPIEASISLASTGNDDVWSDIAGLRALAAAQRTRFLRRGAELREVRIRVDTVTEEGRTLGWVVRLRDATAERKVQRRLELAERMDTVATMIAGLATEAHNPLAILSSNAAFAEEELEAHARALGEGHAERTRVAELVKLVGNARVAGLRITKLIADLRAFALASRPDGTTRADVAPALVRVIEGARERAEARARVTTRISDGLVVALDQERLVQLFGHLFANAIEAIAEGAPSENEIAVVARREEREVVIELRDSGSGIPPELRERVLEPFFSTKELAQGLGLSVCAGIAGSVGGRIDLDRADGGGTLARVVLPVA